MNQEIHSIQSGSVWFVRKLMGLLPEEEVRRLGTAPSVGLRPYNVRTMWRKRLPGIFELLDSVMGTMVIGLQQSEIECLHRNAWRRKSKHQRVKPHCTSAEVKTYHQDLDLWLKFDRVNGFEQFLLKQKGVTAAHLSRNLEKAQISHG